MILSKLLPNKTLLWKEWKNSSILFGVLFFYVAYFTVFQLIAAIIDAKVHNTGGFYGYNSLTDLLFYLGGNEFFFIVITVVLAARMIGGERSRDTFNFLLAMPCSRKEIILNKFVVGLSEVLGAFGINALIMTVLVWFNSSIDFSFSAADIWNWALLNIFVLAVVFAFTMLISTISGTMFGSALLSMIFLFFPLGIWGLIYMNLDYWLPTYRYTFGSFEDIAVLLTIPFYLLDPVKITGHSYLVFAILVVGLYYLTVYLFAKNQMENNGEVLIFDKLEGFFKLGVTVCFALLGGMVIIHSFNIENKIIAAVSYMLVAGIVWLLISWLIKWRKVA